MTHLSKNLNLFRANDAFSRLFSFILSDQDISGKLFSGEELGDEELAKLVKFMINDPYYQN